MEVDFSILESTQKSVNVLQLYGNKNNSLHAQLVVGAVDLRSSYPKLSVFLRTRGGGTINEYMSDKFLFYTRYKVKISYSGEISPTVTFTLPTGVEESLGGRNNTLWDSSSDGAPKRAIICGDGQGLTGKGTVKLYTSMELWGYKR